MTKVTVTCPQHRDETGDFEEFTRDLADVVDTDYSHLDANGLPMIGTFLAPGMLIVGKIGLRKAAIASEPLTELERSCLSDTDRAEYWRSRIYDGSLYASSQNFGRVV
jgi:DNA-directed RNA polymerase beta subunit